MKKYLIILALLFGMSLPVSAQLADGSIAPNFNLTDRDGNSHNLYQYLDEGKVVFIKFFACHCPGCWAYHNTGKLEDLYQTYGPSGTDQIMVLMLEHDQNNPLAFEGVGNFTQGNWETGNSVPMIDVEGADRSVFDDYNLNYYPMIIKVCSDKTTELMSVNYSVSELFQEADDCAGTLDVEAVETTGSVYFDAGSRQLKLNGFETIETLELYNLAGQKITGIGQEANGIVDVSALSAGLYVVNLKHAGGVYTTKIVVQ